MSRLFAFPLAVKLNLTALFLIVAVLIATPIRSQIFAALLMLYAIGYLIAHRATFQVMRFDWVVIGLLSLYLFSQLPAFVLSGYSSRYLSPGFHMLAMVPIYLMLRHLMAPLMLHHFRKWLELGVIASALGAFVLAFYQWFTLPQVDGFLFHINFSYLSCSIGFLALSLMRDSSRKTLLLVAGVAVLVACVLTLSRGGILAIPVLMVLLLSLSMDRLGWKLPLLTLAAIPLISLGSYNMVQPIQDRVDFTFAEFRSIAEGDVGGAVSSGGRLQLWKAASHAFLERPLIGLTYIEREAQIIELIDQGELTQWVASINRGHAHSQYFEMAATGGVLGLIALVGFLIVPGVYQLRVYWRDRSNTYALTAFIFSAGFAIYCLTEAAIHHEMMVAYYSYIQVLLLNMARCRNFKRE